MKSEQQHEAHRGASNDQPREPESPEIAPLVDLVELPLPNLETISVAPDGTRDDTVHGFARALSERAGAGVDEIMDPASAEAISKSSADHQSDLLIVPVPFGQERAGHPLTTLGPIIDELLLNSHCPVLCISEALDASGIEATLESIVVPVTGYDELVARTIGWALRMAQPTGRVRLVGIADSDVVAEASHLVREIADSGPPETDELVESIRDDIGAMVEAAKQRALIEETNLESRVLAGKFLPTILDEVGDGTHLVVWGMHRDHSSLAFHRGVDLLLELPGPVLIVV